MHLFVIAVILIILGILFLSLIPLASQNSIRISDKVVIFPHESYTVPYSGGSEVLFSYNFSNPIKVYGYPSGATITNDSMVYVICFFSSSPGNFTLYNGNNISSTVYFTLYEAYGLALDIEYMFVISPILIVAGIVLILYSKLIKR
ncbi:hypothetical protein EWF20_09825 [Sulfolobus sp. S-194]|uniref:hypothetical protein n=1 Tax=Sulfolobus sp. S-194 TaxID=2512240 RepID=UPI00143723CA|nr:hypothetical protein [Sulfolobus sp. S-194]QIW24418.1 hypothetical protein EWF20_09825 [Sulfolobus sp. S-194]